MLGSALKLRISNNNNSLLFQLFEKTVLVDETVISNGDILDEFEIIKTSFFDNISTNTYLIDISIYGSTYGANRYVIIWENEVGWNLSKTYFPKSRLIDLDKDGFDEIQVLLGVNKGKAYKFSNGNILHYNLKQNN
jgi:hypothetical protein